MFFGKLVLESLFFWLPTYLQEGMHYSKDDALNMYSLFSIGGLLGNVIMGLVSDLVPMRTPVFEVGVVLSVVLTTILGTYSSGTGGQSEILFMCVVIFCLGAFHIGTFIIIAAIECDMGNYVRKTQGIESLGTFAGIIDGVASTGSVLSQFLIVAIKNEWGWRGAFDALAVFLFISGLPAISFLFFEIKQWK